MLFIVVFNSFIVFLFLSIVGDRIGVELELWDFEGRMGEVFVCRWERKGCFIRILVFFCVDEIFFFLGCDDFGVLELL